MSTIWKDCSDVDQMNDLLFFLGRSIEMKLNNKQRKLLLKAIEIARANYKFNDEDYAELDLLVEAVGKYVKKGGEE